MAKRQAAGRKAGRKTTSTKKAARPARRTTRAKPEPPTPVSGAIQAYERGLAAIQRHDYAEGHRILTDILTDFPAEGDVLDRVRLYLQICERHRHARPSRAQTVDDHLYAATLALNTGDRAGALDHLAVVQKKDADNDHALYMLGVLQALSGERDASVEYLRRAIALNPDNKALARYDPELESLRSTDAFKLLLDAPPRRTRGRRSR